MTENGKVGVRKWRNPSAEELLSGIQLDSEANSFYAQDLQAHIIQVTEGVYVGVDYGFANSIFLEGPEKVIVVDAAESITTSSRIIKDFRKICSKPITAIIYTDHHGDHWKGVHAYVEDPTNPPDIWAHVSQKKELHQLLLTGPRVMRGNLYQFGMALQAGDKSCENPRFHKELTDQAKPMPANHYVTQDVEEVEIAGIKLTLIYQPGEAGDELAVWLPDKRVLLPGDNFYPEFPNIYSLRGVAPRDARDWHQSLAKLRELKSEHFVPTHGNPITGEKEIHEVLTGYMASIQFVHDQTMRFLNQGLHPDEIASRIKLPTSLSQKWYLPQEYGLIEWSVKGVYNQQVGWFTEDPQELTPHTPAARSKRMVEMVGEAQLIKQAEQALGKDDPQWALELSSYVLVANPGNAEAKDVRTEALLSLAGRQKNPIVRNFYLTTAFNDHSLIDWSETETNPFTNLEIMDVLSLMKIMLKAELVEEVTLTVLLDVNHSEENYRLQISYSVLAVDTVPKISNEPYDVKVSASSELFKRILVEKFQSVSQYENEGLKIEGSPEKLTQFIGYFDV